MSSAFRAPGLSELRFRQCARNLILETSCHRARRRWSSRRRMFVVGCARSRKERTSKNSFCNCSSRYDVRGRVCFFLSYSEGCSIGDLDMSSAFRAPGLSELRFRQCARNGSRASAGRHLLHGHRSRRRRGGHYGGGCSFGAPAHGKSGHRKIHSVIALPDTTYAGASAFFSPTRRDAASETSICLLRFVLRVFRSRVFVSAPESDPETSWCAEISDGRRRCADRFAR